MAKKPGSTPLPAGLTELVEPTSAPEPAPRRRWECSLAWSPTLTVEAGDMGEAHRKYLRACNVLHTPHVVKIVEVTDEQP